MHPLRGPLWMPVITEEGGWVTAERPDYQQSSLKTHMPRLPPLAVLAKFRGVRGRRAGMF